MEPVSMVVAVVIFILGFVVGKVNRSKSKEFNPPKPICSCLHPYGMHDEKGNCVAEKLVAVNHVQKVFGCPCIRYDGPRPVETFFATQMLPPD